MFRKVLENGHPPDDWSQLLGEASAECQRVQQFAAGITEQAGNKTNRCAAVLGPRG